MTQSTDLPISRQEIAEIKATLDTGRVPLQVELYSADVIMGTMLFYELEDEYNADRLSWPEFASGALKVSKMFLEGD